LITLRRGVEGDSPDWDEATHGQPPDNHEMARSRESVFALRSRLAVAGVLGVVTAAALAGCGSSSKPAYCTDVTNFKNSVDQLKNDLKTPTALPAQIAKVSSTGQTALSAVKTNFAPETSAVKTSLAALENSAKQLTSSSTRLAAATAIPAQTQALVASVQSLADAAKSGKCG
jgi:hypothetical protein